LHITVRRGIETQDQDGDSAFWSQIEIRQKSSDNLSFWYQKQNVVFNETKQKLLNVFKIMLEVNKLVLSK